jgi:hypothetical protein
MELTFERSATMRPMLDDLELPQVQSITVRDKRSLAEHKPPGMAGSLLQNLGRRPTSLVLCGVVTGDGADDFAKKLDKKFRAAAPVPFTSDIVADAKIDQVLIDDVCLEQLAGKPGRYGYIVSLREFIKPVQPADASALDTSILGDARNLVDGIVDGLSIAQAFATGLEKFVPVFTGLLSRAQQANSASS